MSPEQRAQAVYTAFNERDEATALAGLDAQVQWDDGQGHMLAGKQAVADHWREQWRTADARVQIDSMQRNGRELILLATLETAKPDGTRNSQPIRNTIRFSDDLIASMQIG
jgi:hypothetical protein